MYGYIFRAIIWPSSDDSSKINSKSQLETSFKDQTVIPVVTLRTIRFKIKIKKILLLHL